MKVVKPSEPDLFCHYRLPALADWPRFHTGNRPIQSAYDLNAAEVLLRAGARAASSNGPAIYMGEEVWSYGRLAERVDQVVHVLRDDLALVQGQRVLLRGYNSPWLVVCWLAVVKAGLVAVATMPLLRSTELQKVVDKARVSVVLCEDLLIDETASVQPEGNDLRILTFGDDVSELSRLADSKPSTATAAPTLSDDVCLLAFTSGTTGEPKACVQFHRDVLAICETYQSHVLQGKAGDCFIGTPPLAFTFGLGALLIFPLWVGASIVFPQGGSPDALAVALERRKPTTLFTSPTAYRRLLDQCEATTLSSLITCVSAGEHLPLSIFDKWRDRTGTLLLDGIGATEMMHIFISSRPDLYRPGSTGTPVPGYRATILDEAGNEQYGEAEGRLAVTGPTGCRYLDDPRQSEYVQRGWNVTGDLFRRDADGFYWFVARADSMIVSSGYNIAAPEVEGALLTHDSVAECAVVGTPDAVRGQLVTAFIVLHRPDAGSPDLVADLQGHVKSSIAPYKYPRKIVFLNDLPKTPSGKVQRKALLGGRARAEH